MTKSTDPSQPLSEVAIRALVEELLDRRESDLIRYAISLCGNRDLAEDAVQETFLRVSRSLRLQNPVRRLNVGPIMPGICSIIVTGVHGFVQRCIVTMV